MKYSNSDWKKLPLRLWKPFHTIRQAAIRGIIIGVIIAGFSSGLFVLQSSVEISCAFRALSVMVAVGFASLYIILALLPPRLRRNWEDVPKEQAFVTSILATVVILDFILPIAFQYLGMTRLC
jgi:hypothetical protein